jgi:hypothetical protein
MKVKEVTPLDKNINRLEKKILNLQFQALIQNAYELGVENTLTEIEEKLLNLQLDSMFQKAYERGVEDARAKYSTPEIMTRTETMEFLKCGSTTMTELMKRPDFPVIREFGVRVPTRLLLKWIEQNTRWVEKNTNYFEQEAI